MSTDATPRHLASAPPPPPRPRPDDDAASRWFARWDAATVDVEDLAALAYRQAGEIAQLSAYLRLAHAAGDRAAGRCACAVVVALVLAGALVARTIGGL